MLVGGSDAQYSIGAVAAELTQIVDDEQDEVALLGPTQRVGLDDGAAPAARPRPGSRCRLSAIGPCIPDQFEGEPRCHDVIALRCGPTWGRGRPARPAEAA